jgi:hypothetical protein
MARCRSQGLARGAVAALAAALALGGGACKSGGGIERGGLKELEGGIEIGLRRGSSWSTYTVRPPHIIGPRGTLKIRRGRMTGAIAGRQANIEILPEGLTGHVGGTVEIDIDGGQDDIEVSGLWSGSRVHFTITPESLRGTIDGTGPAEPRCQYVLDRVEADGSRSGTSICSGLPEETLLEFPRTIQGWLTRNEAIGVLLALLASPPLTAMEPGPY